MFFLAEKSCDHCDRLPRSLLRHFEKGFLPISRVEISFRGTAGHPEVSSGLRGERKVGDRGIRLQNLLNHSFSSLTSAL